MRYPHSPGFKGEANTGKEAAKDIQGRAGTLRRLALDCLSMDLLRFDLTDGHGLTADEVATQCRCSILAMRPRLSELKGRGLIEDSGQRRSNKSGKAAVVWQLVLNPQSKEVADAEESVADETVSQQDLFRGDEPGGTPCVMNG